ncbi:phytoene desaturase family protein [Euzebya tangerina]|uniref:phytoene desaturase family protein n=1 Tax=Euzebya tangerina TaxID=591198 RepID=UPI0013C2B9C9|nr:FAD-dependent oxidoreductase [Euzebya tangerina]
MSEYDVIVIGAGAAGLSAAALLAKEGRSVLLLERSPYLGGRGMATDDEGYQLNLGAHLMEDSGSGLTRIFAHLGRELGHGPKNTDMPVWNHETQSWGSIRDRYSGDKDELKKVIAALMETSYEELEQWDDRPMRDWIHQHTDHQGVVDLFEFITVMECMTEDWWDHSASENLFVRKMHYEEKQTAAYSYWPVGGWDAMFTELRDAVVENGGEVRLGQPVSRVVMEDRTIVGVALPRADAVLPNEVFHEEIVTADVVISTLPVWHVLQLVDPNVLPDWYVQQIETMAQDRWRISWAGLYMATEEPVSVLDRQEIATWMHTPVANTSGFMFEMSALDPSVAPEGKHLYVMGAMLHGFGRNGDMAFVKQKFDEFEQDVEIMWPGLADHVFKRRHLVYDPSFGVIQKPGLVGQFRPNWKAPNVEGLYFASETFKARGIGIDRAARVGLSAAEDILGRRLWPLEEGFRY